MIWEWRRLNCGSCPTCRFGGGGQSLTTHSAPVALLVNTIINNFCIIFGFYIFIIFAGFYTPSTHPLWKYCMLGFLFKCFMRESWHEWFVCSTWVVFCEVICIKGGTLLVDNAILLLVASVPYPVISSMDSFWSSEGDFSMSNSLSSRAVAVNWRSLKMWVSKCFEYYK